jgi:phosphoglucosamine mutase
MARLFGTDGVRGIANTELSCELAFRLGQASAYVLASDVHRPTILVGRDTRLSGEMLESALVAGICSVGARAVLVEVLPTPAIAYLTRFYEADAGAAPATIPSSTTASSSLTKTATSCPTPLRTASRKS